MAMHGTRTGRALTTNLARTPGGHSLAELRVHALLHSPRSVRLCASALSWLQPLSLFSLSISLWLSLSLSIYLSVSHSLLFRV